MAVSVDYDPEEVMNNIKNKYVSSVEDLANNLNSLISELETCQDTFHCKGGSSSNAVIKIYQGFADAIGKSNGSTSGEGLGGLTAYSAAIMNTVYTEAKNDWDRLQQTNNFNW